MSEWKEYKFSDIIELIGGGTPKTSISEYWNGDIPWLSVADFNTGKKLVFDTEKKITELGFQNSSTNLLNKGDIIISARGTVGVVAVLGEKMTFNQSCYGIKAMPNKSINDYVYYLLKNTVSNFTQIAHGGVFDTITRDTFKEIDILLPPLPEQKSIASILSSLDDKIDLLHRQNATLEAMAETLFRQRFVEEAKEEWEEGILSDFGEVITGKTPSKENPNYWGNKYHFVTPTDFKDFGMFTNQPTRGLSELGWSKMKSLQLPEKSILVTCIGSDMGKVTIASQPCITNQQLNSIIVKDKRYLGFVFEHIKSQYQHIRNIAFGGTTMPIINKTDFSNIITPLPSEDTVEIFNSQWELLSNKVFINQTQICTLTSLRDTLLPKLMSGEVRVEV